MSSTHTVTVICDSCGLKDTKDSGSFCRTDWCKLNVEFYAYPDRPYLMMDKHVRANGDFCPDCTKKHTRSQLVQILTDKEMP